MRISRRRAALLVAAIVPAIGLGISQGVGGMFGSKADIICKWEWPAGRPVADWRLVRVDSFDKLSTGFLGIGRSPSIADNLPDAHRLTGAIESGDNKGKRLRLDLPGREIAPVEPGALVALGLIGEGVCICATPVPPDVPAAEALDWAASQDCG